MAITETIPADHPNRAVHTTKPVIKIMLGFGTEVKYTIKMSPIIRIDVIITFANIFI